MRPNIWPGKTWSPALDLAELGAAPRRLGHEHAVDRGADDQALHVALRALQFELGLLEVELRLAALAAEADFLLWEWRLPPCGDWPRPARG
jgi:hypothetical protein